MLPVMDMLFKWTSAVRPLDNSGLRLYIVSMKKITATDLGVFFKFFYEGTGAYVRWDEDIPEDICLDGDFDLSGLATFLNGSPYGKE